MAKKDELNFENGNNMAGSEKLKVRPRWQSMPSPKHKRQAASQHSSMRNTLSTASMQPNWV